MPEWETKRILIWGKTYPELSEKYRETVCTAGVDESGQPIRLYPVPLRYLQRDQQFALYNWVRVPIRKARLDSRPESFNLDRDKIQVVGSIGPDAHEWAERRRVLFADPAWHFGSMEALKREERSTGRSLGWIQPGEICGTDVEDTPEEERKRFDEKLARLRRQSSLLDSATTKSLRFRSQKVFLLWRCPEPCRECARSPHRMQALDWGLMELGFREGWDAVRAKLEEISTLDRFDFRLFLGNMKAHRRSFSVVGLWYPKRRVQAVLL